MLQGDDVLVLFETPLKAAAEEVIRIYPGIKSEIEKRFRWKLDYKPTVILVKEREKFQGIVGHSLFVAFANPERKLIMIDYSRMNTHPFTLATTLKHELCHLLFHRHIRGDNLPRWFDEGVAQWASEGIGEIIMANGKRILNRASLSGNYIPLGRLKYHFPRDKIALTLAYEESKSCVEYITGTYGIDSLLDIMNRLKEGETMADAVLWSLSVSLEELEENWHEHLRKQTPWLTYLSMNLYQILFILGAIITVIGFIRYLIKKRRQEDWEDFE
ncbi:MAG: peptidase MA family metallohydrolase [Thermodesulfobacteriota bacterium]|nr:peptidase MA family metallohydrolase [Thermodesulfobacteriota bacterium]